MTVNPSSLKNATAALQVSTPCHHCGYDLIGLSPGAACPECGTHIPVKRSGLKGDNLADAPIAFLRRFAWAMLLNAFILPVAIVAANRAPFSNFAALFSLAAAAALVGSTWLVTMQRGKSDRSINDNILDNPKWRLGIRLATSAWLLLAAGNLVNNAAAAGSWGVQPFVEFLVAALTIAAGISIVPLFIHHATFAGWAGDRGLESRLRGCAWLIVACTVVQVLAGILLALVPTPIKGFFGLAIIFSGILYFATWLVAIVGVLQLASVAFSAVGASKATIDRDARVAARRAREMADTVDRQFSAPEPVDPYSDMMPTQNVPAPEPALPPKGQLQRIESENELDAYDLAPVEEPNQTNDRQT